MSGELSDDFNIRYELLKIECVSLGMTPPVAKPSLDDAPTLWMGNQCVGGFVHVEWLAKKLKEMPATGVRSDISGEDVLPGWFIFGHNCPDEKSAAAEIRARVPR